MAHPKLKNIQTFADQYKDQLDLDKAQIVQLDELEYQHWRDRYFNRDFNDGEKALPEKVLSRRNQILTSEQIKRLQSLQLQEKEKKLAQDQEMKLEELQGLRNTFQALALDENSLEIFYNILETAKEIVKDKGFEAIKAQQRAKDFNEELTKEAIRLLKGFLSVEQLNIFQQIREKQRIEGKKWLIGVIKSNYPELKLSDYQADQIARFEKHKHQDENGRILNFWEQQEVEKKFMQDLLSESQFQLKLKWMAEEADDEVAGLKKSDQNYVQWIKRTENRITYQIEHHLPVLCYYRKILENRLRPKEKDFLKKLRIDYFNHLVGEFERIKKQFTINGLILQPNYLSYYRKHLQEAVLSASALFFDRQYAKIQENIRNSIIALIDIKTPAIEKAKEALQQFDIQNYETTGGTYGAFVFFGKMSKTEIRDRRIIAQLLLEPILEKNIEHMEQFITETM